MSNNTENTRQFYLVEYEVNLNRDNYKEGFIEEWFEHANQKMVKAEGPLEAIKGLLEDLGYDLNDNLFADEDSNRVLYSEFVNVDDDEPTEKEVQDWKDGKIDLYVREIRFTINKVEPIKISDYKELKDLT